MKIDAAAILVLIWVYANNYASARVLRLFGDPKCDGTLETHVEMTYDFFEGTGYEPNEDAIADLLVATETFFATGFSLTFRTPADDERRMQEESDDLPLFQGMDVSLLNNTYAPGGDPDQFLAWYSVTTNFTGNDIPTSTEIVFLLETSDLNDFVSRSPFLSQTENIELRATPYREVVYCEVDNSIPSCLSPYSIVQVKDEGPLFIKDVDENAEILVSVIGETKKYQPVYAFSHKDMYSLATFIQVHTTGNDGSPMELTSDHLIFRSDSLVHSIPVRADSIQVGDLLTGETGDDEVVLEIFQVLRQGVYSPLTEEGALLANGAKVSSYTALPEHPDNQFIDFAGVKSITHHSFLHVAAAPFRYLCRAGLESVCMRSKDSEGQLLFVTAGKHIISWVRKRAIVLPSLALSVLLMGMIALSVLEQLFFAISFASILVATLYFIFKMSTTLGGKKLM